MASRGADVVCLQEVTATTLPRWREALGDLTVCCLLPERRRLAVLLAGRGLDEAPVPEVGRPESVRARRSRWRSSAFSTTCSMSRRYCSTPVALALP